MIKHNYRRDIFADSVACTSMLKEQPRAFKHISHEFAKKFVLFRGSQPDMLAYHRLLVLCDTTLRDLEQCAKEGLSICKFSGAIKWLHRAKQMYCDLYNGVKTFENVDFDEKMYAFFLKGGTL